MQPGPDQPTNVQDSVVGRDMHTGNVIHNHYHLPPTPQAPPAPQTIIIQQPPPLQHQMPFPGQQMGPMVPIKKIYSLDWVIFGVLSILLSFVPGLNLCCGLVSIVAILSLLPHVNIRRMQPNHPEAKNVVPAIVLNSIALFLIFFSWLLMNS
tara:strand:- start:723 stop:1178 length:456 start_codon:yes stop_codon:yes gene_type:complete